LRVSIPRLGLDRLVDSAFEQIRSYSTRDIVVSLRLMRALGDLGATIPDRRIRELLAERGRRVVEGVSNELGEQDVKDLRIRLAALEQAALEA